MTLIYCIKCGDKTNSIDEKVVITKNNRKRITAVCVKCKSKKSMFISSSGNKKKTDGKTKKKEPVEKKQTTKKTKKKDSATTVPKTPKYNLTTQKKQESTIKCCLKCLKKCQQYMDKIKTIRP